MIDRRELLFGIGCVAAIGTAQALKPRRNVVLLPEGMPLRAAIPTQVGEWSVGPDGDIVIPETPGTLATRLYSDRVARSFRRAGDDGSNDIMMLAAYGGAQSDVLQLHRPEVCYPAIGFSVSGRREGTVPLGAGVVLPIVMLTAQAGGRVEDVVSFPRLGEEFPQDGSAQRGARLRAAMHGFVADGVLLRVSALRHGDEPRFEMLTAFLHDMIVAAPVSGRPVLVGSGRARALTGAA